jgi:LysR family transcriptional activator of nhaA
MDWLNYHHLFYFWSVAHEGTVSAAARQLHLARPTVTAQIRELEKAVGQQLFRQKGRSLVLTEFGQQILEYADEIFSVGHELREFVKTGHPGTRQRFRVGMPDVLPKLIAFELLKPALQGAERPRTECYEGKLLELLTDLAKHKLDLVLSDSPAPTTLDFNVFSHKLGECGLSLLAISSLARKLQKGFPETLTNAPMLLPSQHTTVRRSLDRWLDERDLFPTIVAEFDDSALLKVFGQAGEGVFPVPTAIEDRVKKQYGVALVGRVPEVLDVFYAISVEKRVEHQATLRILKQAANTFFNKAPQAS